MGNEFSDHGDHFPPKEFEKEENGEIEEESKSERNIEVNIIERNNNTKIKPRKKVMDPFLLEMNKKLNIKSEIDLYSFTEEDLKKLKLIQKSIKSHLVRKKIRDLIKIINKNPQLLQDIKKRKNVMKEIISTEKTYVESLKSLIEFYYDPLKGKKKKYKKKY